MYLTLGELTVEAGLVPACYFVTKVVRPTDLFSSTRKLFPVYLEAKLLEVIF